MLRTILIDDEQHSLDSLLIEIQRHCPELEVIDACKGAIPGLKAIESNRPDLVFLDIDMPVKNGFELLQEISDRSFDVIFVTAYDEYAVRAIKVSAMDYLLKPVDPADLVESVRKVLEKRTQEDPQTKLEVLLTNLENVQTAFSKLAIPTLDGLDFVNIDDIIYCIADGSYTHIHTANGNEYLISRTMKETAELLSGTTFFRTHQSYLVNLNYITRYIKGSGGQLIMKDGRSIQVARSRKESLMQVIFQSG